MINTIFNESNLITLDRMPANLLHLTITSPPYNVDLGNNKYNKNGYDQYADNKEYKQYISELKEVFSKVYDKTVDGGRCVINIGDGKNGRIATHADIIHFMHDIGWLVYAQIIWDKSQVGNRCAWGSFKSPNSPAFPTPFEYILIFSKGSLKLNRTGLTDLTKAEFMQYAFAKWTFPGASGKKMGHPAIYPVELPLRCMKMLSYVGDVVYDPFMGSGTTAVAAIKSGRQYIGSDISPDYCAIAEKRIAEAKLELSKNAENSYVVQEGFEFYGQYFLLTDIGNNYVQIAHPIWPIKINTPTELSKELAVQKQCNQLLTNFALVPEECWTADAKEMVEWLNNVPYLVSKND